MNKLIKGVKRLALALCLATPIVSWAAMEFTDPTYTPWSGVSGAAAWRGDGGNFEVSKVADIAADGTIGETYQMQWNNTVATTAKRFCSVCTTTAHQGYVSPGMLLVYDAPGYAATANGTFGPLSFGGLKVDALANVEQGTPYELNSPNAGGARYTDFGVANFSSYFEFNKSFIISRVNDLRCYGDVTIKAAEGATFKCTKALWIENNSTVALQGAGTVELTEGLRMNASSTLDLSAETCPTIAAAVTIPAGATLVLPAGTELDTDVEIDICTGTLTVSGIINVKVGDADAVETVVTTSEGKITRIDTGITYTADFPTTVPAGSIYIYVGGETAEGAVEIAGVTVNGKLKTQGYVNLTGLTVNNGGTLDVVDGNTTATAATNGYGDRLITGNLIVRAGATLTPTQGDFLDYYNASAQTVDIYGTVAMGATRWSIKASPSQTVNLYPGALVTGTGDAHGVFDLYQAASKLNVYPGDNGGEVVIEGVVRTRNANTPIWIAANTTLKIGGLREGGINKSGNGTLEISGTVTSPAASTVSEGTIAFVDTTVAVPLTVNAGKTVTASASEGVTVPLNVTMNASANITVSGAGTVNGTLTYSGVPSGTLTGLTTSTWEGTVVLGALNAPTALPLNNLGNANSKIVLTGTTGNCYLNGTTTVAAEVVVGTDENSVVEFNNGNSNQVGTFSKVSGPGTLKLVGWTGCSAATYVLSTLDNFEGLAIANNITRDGGGTFTVRIGNIVTTRTTNPGDCVLPIANTALDNATGTVVYDLTNAKVNGNTLDLEAKEDGIYVVVPAANVTVTVPAVPNTTVVVTANGEPVTGDNGSYVVPEGSEVVATYTAVDGYEMTGTASYTIDSATEGAAVTPAITTKQYVAYVVFQVEQGQSFVDVTNYYTTVAAAIDAAKALKKTIVLIAQPDAEDTYAISVGEVINVKKGEFTFDGIVFPTGAQYNNTTTVTAGVTTYKCTIYTATVQYPGQDPVGMTGQLIQILGGLYSNYQPAYAGTVVTVLDGSDATLGDFMPEVFTYDSEAHTYTLKTMVASYYNGHTTTYYPTLAYALDTVPASGTVKLIADVDVVSTGLTFPADKTITFDLNGYTLTAGNGATSHVQVNGVVTITDSSEGAEGQIVSAEVGTYGLVQVAESNTQEGAALTIAGGTIEAYFPETLNKDEQHPAYGVVVKGKDTVFNMTGGKVKAGLMAVMGHGSKASGGTYTISGGTIESVDDFAMYLSTKGGCSVTISGGTFVGQGAVSARAGTVTVTGGTFTASGDGVAPGSNPGTTGLGFMALAVTPNYAAVEVTVSGGVFTSATGVAAVGLVESTYAGSIALTGGTYSTDVTDFCANGYAATEDNGVWTVAEKKGIDPTDPTSAQEVVIEPTGDPDTDKAAAIAQAEVTVPEAVATATGVDAATYKSYFKLQAVETITSGTYEVSIVDLADEVKTEVAETAAEAIAANDVDEYGNVTVTVKPGLYYGFDAKDDLGSLVEPTLELATSTSIKVAKPGTTKGFIKVKISTTAD